MAQRPSTDELDAHKREVAEHESFAWSWVLVPLAVVGVLLIVGYGFAVFRARRVAAVTSSSPRVRVAMDIATISSALDVYAIENGGSFPVALAELTKPDASGRTYLKMPAMLTDPWGHAYSYSPPSGSRTYVIGTLGRDGAVGGAGDDEDYDNGKLPHAAPPP